MKASLEGEAREERGRLCQGRVRAPFEERDRRGPRPQGREAVGGFRSPGEAFAEVTNRPRSSTGQSARLLSAACGFDSRRGHHALRSSTAEQAAYNRQTRVRHPAQRPTRKERAMRTATPLDNEGRCAVRQDWARRPLGKQRNRPTVGELRHRDEILLDSAIAVMFVAVVVALPAFCGMVYQAVVM